jgi:hypothetical protein
MSNRDTEQLFSSHQKMVLGTPAFQGVPFFPREVEQIQTLEALIWWLGATNFPASPLGADAVALSLLSLLQYQLDSSYEGFMRLIFFITNVDTPGFFLGHEQKQSASPQPQRISRYEASRGIAHAVKGRPYLRKAMAQYLIFEYDLAGYETLTLAQCALHVEQEYKWEFGDKAFISSTRDVANALAGAETERTSLGKMLTFALEIGTHHIRSRLAVNWLANVHLRDPALQQTLDHLKQMSMKQIWRQKMTTYSSDDPEFLNVLRRGGTFEGQHN